MSWYDFARDVFDLSGMDDVIVSAVRSSEYPTAAKRPAYSVLAKEKIKTAGIPVPYWRDSLRECIAILTRRE